MTTVYLLLGTTGALVLVGILLWMAVALYVGYTRLGEIMACFQNSPGVRAKAFLRDAGILGKLNLIASISSLVTFPANALATADVCPEDLQSLPPLLRRKLIVLQCTLIFLNVSLFVIGGLLWLTPVEASTRL